MLGCQPNQKLKKLWICKILRLLLKKSAAFEHLATPTQTDKIKIFNIFIKNLSWSKQAENTSILSIKVLKGEFNKNQAFLNILEIYRKIFQRCLNKLIGFYLWETFVANIIKLSPGIAAHHHSIGRPCLSQWEVSTHHAPTQTGR